MYVGCCFFVGYAVVQVGLKGVPPVSCWDQGVMYRAVVPVLSSSAFVAWLVAVFAVVAVSAFACVFEVGARLVLLLLWFM